MPTDSTKSPGPFDHDTLGGRIEYALFANGVAKGEFAEALSGRVGKLIRPARVSQWIGNHQTPEAPMIRAIAAELGVPIRWLTIGEGTPFPDDQASSRAMLAQASRVLEAIDASKITGRTELQQLDELRTVVKNLAARFESDPLASVEQAADATAQQLEQPGAQPAPKRRARRQ